MQLFTILLGILAVFFLPGYTIWLNWYEKVPTKFTLLEVVFGIFLSSVVVLSLPAIFLASVGWFSGELLIGFSTICCLMVIGLRAAKKKNLNPFQHTNWSPTDALAVGLLLVAIMLSPEAYKYLVGGRDHGIYVNTGINIAQTGNIIIQDPDLAALSPESIPHLTQADVSEKASLNSGPWSEGQRMPGFTIRDAANGLVVPHAFHLYPVWIAILYEIGGISWALGTTVLLGLLGTLGIYVTVSRFANKYVSLMTLLLMVMHVTHMWFNQYPTAEILVRFLFWGGFWLFLLLLNTKQLVVALLAGICFGLLHLTKLDTLFVPLSLFIYLFFIWITNRWQRYHLVFVLSYFVTSVLALVYAFTVATVYFLDQMSRVILPQSMAQWMMAAVRGYTYPSDIWRQLFNQSGLWIIVVFVGGGVLAGLLWWLRSWLQKRLRFPPVNLSRVRLGIGVLMGAAFVLVYGLSYYGVAFPKVSTTLALLVLYLTFFGLFLGVIGMCMAVSLKGNGRYHDQSDFATYFLLANTIPLLILGSGTFPDHFWTIRRFIPVVIPTFLFYVAYTLWLFVPKTDKHRWRMILPLGLAVFLLFSYGQTLWPLIKVVEYDTLPAQLNSMSTQFPEDAVLLFDATDGDPANRMSLPLWLLFDHSVYMVQEGSLGAPELESAIKQWIAQGRPVYWLDAKDDSPMAWHELAAHYQETVNIAAPMTEMSLDRIPAVTGTYLASFDIFELDVDATEQSSTVKTMVPLKIPDDAIMTGVDHTELLRAGLWSRGWVSHDLLMQIPYSEAVQNIALLLGSPNSRVDTETELAIYVNDQFQQSVHVTDSVQLVTVPMPANGQQHNPAIALKVETVANSHNEKSSGGQGFYLYWVKVISHQVDAD
ncbi:MAG: hypothetical protein CSA11_03855 [Chloroflexi bacterium]|nr:MAG: hypothetical protein CSA11_03855 [Chloroflexota bacterium]